MNTEKVFIIHDENSNEVLLYKKDSDTYIDLLNNKSYTNIDYSKLTPFSSLFSYKLKKYALKSTIKERYNFERKTQLSIENIYIGKVYMNTGIIGSKKIIPTDEIYKRGDWYQYYEHPNIEYEFSSYVVRENVLLYKKDDIFLDLINEIQYISQSNLNYHSKNTLGVCYVPDSKNDLIPFSFLLNDSSVHSMSKYLVLESYYNKRKKEL